MSDGSQEQQEVPSAAETASSPFRGVLFLILAVMVVALAYDYMWARKQPDLAASRVVARIQPDASATISDVTPPTMKEVEQLVEGTPAERFEGPNYWQLKYSWRAGLPWKTHDLYVVFTKSDPPLYYSHSVFQPPIETDLPHRTQSEVELEAIRKEKAAAAAAAATGDDSSGDEPAAATGGDSSGDQPPAAGQEGAATEKAPE